MSTIEKAIELAAREHAGDTDKSGQPYIFHPLRLMFAVSASHEKMAAVLHDVVEDTQISLDDLRDMKFPEAVIIAVDALTKREGESRLDAAKRAADNAISLAVKLADVTDNMDLRRIDNPTDKDFKRLQEYAEVRRFLLSKLAAIDVGGIE